MANELSGYLDYIYSHGDSKTTAAGATTDTESDAFRQQYGLTLNKSIFPKLRLLAGGIFEKDWFASTADGSEVTSRTTSYRPFVDLTLHDPFFTASAGYNRQQTTSRTSGSPATTLVSETYTGILGWRPDALPSIEARWRKTHAFDKERSHQDMVDDYISVTSAYEPVTNLRLRYQRSVDDAVNKLQDTETRTVTDSGKASYESSFFRNRVSFYTSYDIARRETDVLKTTTGEVSIQIFPLAGLSAIDDTPAEGAMDPTPLLIDGNTAASAGVTIGLPVSVPGARNIGMDFGSETELDTLAVWVTWNNTSLPVEIANYFSWDVYTSSNNLNWTSVVTVSPAAFDPLRNRFEIRIPKRKARYIKVAVKPLTQAAAASSIPFSTAADQQIYVTELQAFITKTPGGPLVTTTRLSDVIVRTRLMDAPLLTYDFAYFTFISEGLTTARRSSLSNGLSVSHRFSEAFSGSARAAREDSSDPQGETVAYVSTATVNAAPMKTLSHTLTYSGRTEHNPQEKSVRHSVFMNNTAALYRGIDVFLSGGLSHGRVDTGRKTDSALLLFGATLAPRGNLTISPSYSVTRAEQRGGGVPEYTSSTRRGDVTVSYAPLPTLYITASRSKVSQTGQKSNTFQNYNVSWSPFPGGALQVSVSYTENLRSADNSVDKLLSTAVRWNITQRMFITASYANVQTTSALQESKSSVFATELRYSF